MLKALLKKQFLELSQFYFRNRKTGRRRTAAGIVGMAILYAFILLSLGFAFGMMAFQLADAMVPAGMDWLFFSLMSMAAIFLGIFGSVFNTYAGLYHAKDNELLLSMPIPPKYILLTRMIGVYILGLVFEALVLVPAMVVYWIVATPTVAQIIFPILLVFILGFLVLALTCALGWVVALVASRLKNKSFITVILSLAFFAVYYVFYFRLNSYLLLLNENMAAVGDTVRRVLYPFYQMGLAACGNGVSLLIVTALCALLMALTVLVLARSFRSIVTTNRGAKKTVYREKAAKRASTDAALLRKEAKRFLGSPTYMLNCGLGAVLTPVLAIAALVKRETLLALLSALPLSEGLLALIVAAVMCLCSCMIDVSAPSVSLEGKNLWVVQVMPVDAWSVLKAKLRLHCIVGLPSLLVSAVIIGIALRLTAVQLLLVCAATVVFTLLEGTVGLAVNLRHPNLTWSNETAPVKQSFAVFLCLMGGWLIVAVFGVAHALLRLAPLLYLALVTALLLLSCLALLLWLRKRGAAIFAAL